MSKLTCVRQAHKEEQTYEDFLESRKSGFGGSDIGDLLDSEPYGCKRRLFLERLGLLPDRVDSMRHHLERGKFFEAPVADLYAKKTGREVKPCGTGYLREYTFVRSNADRLILSDNGKGWGNLEIKVPSAWSFKKIKKEGLPEAYILQLQWQMLCYGTTWGSFAVYWPDGHELLWFDVERDPELIQMLFDKAQREWKWLEVFQGFAKEGMQAAELFKDSAFPGERDERSQACAKCPAFELCHGHEQAPAGSILELPELEKVAEEYQAATQLIKNLEDQKDQLKATLKEAFAKMPVEQIKAGKFSVTLREQERQSLDTEKVKKELESRGVLVEYMKQTKFETLTVRVQKEGKK